VVTTAGSRSEYDWVEGLARAVMVGAPIAVGLYARERKQFERFGTVLIAVGIVWGLATLAGSRDEVLYSVGRVAFWMVKPGDHVSHPGVPVRATARACGSPGRS
jgi:hypothetical protein